MLHVVSVFLGSFSGLGFILHKISEIRAHLVEHLVLKVKLFVSALSVQGLFWKT